MYAYDKIKRKYAVQKKMLEGFFGRAQIISDNPSLHQEVEN